MSLPKELRDLIYGFVLTDPESLRYRSIRTSEGRLYRVFHTSNNDYDEFNQLKYVCKELCRDTKDLEVKLNDLAFCSQPEAVHQDIYNESQVLSKVSGARLLRDFATRIPSSLTPRNIYILGPPKSRHVTTNGAMGVVETDFDDEDIRALFEICQSNQNVMIYMDIVGCNAIEMDLITFLGFSLDVIGARRKGIVKELVPVMEHDHLPGIYPNKNTDDFDLAKIAKKEWPDNFRGKPQGNFDECSFRNKVQEENKTEGYVFLDVDKLCFIAAQWHSHGFFGEEERQVYSGSAQAS
jgi:hypothetical protein